MSDITPPTLYIHCPTLYAMATPRVTLPSTLIPVSIPPSTLIYMGDFLLSQGRCKHQVLGDGNCLFSSLSHQLYGSVEYYSQLQYGLVQLIEKNDSTYRKYWIKRMDWGNVTFGDHMQ